MLHDPKTVIGSDFDQETAEKIAPPFIARLELANCRFWKTWSVIFFCQQWTIIPFASGEIPLRQRQLKLQNSCGSGWERTEWDGPSIIEKQNLIGAWRAQHSFLAHPQPPAMIRISRAYNFAGFWETPVHMLNSAMHTRTSASIMYACPWTKCTTLHMLISCCMQDEAVSRSVRKLWKPTTLSVSSGNKF